MQALNTGDTLTDSVHLHGQRPRRSHRHGAARPSRSTAPTTRRWRVDDTGSATEAGGTNNGTAGTNATGNVLTNDTDVDNTNAADAAAIRPAVTGGHGRHGARRWRSARHADAQRRRHLHLRRQRQRPGGAGAEHRRHAHRHFTYTVSDPGGLTDTAQLTITIHGADDAPVAVDDAGSAIEAGGIDNGTAGTNATGNVLANDTDVDNTTCVAGGIGDPDRADGGSGTAGTVGAALTGAHGTLTLNADGTYTYVVNNSDAAVQALNTGDTLHRHVHLHGQRPRRSHRHRAARPSRSTAPTTRRWRVDDAGSATEAGGINNGTPGTNATGNVLTNDTDVDNTTCVAGGVGDPDRADGGSGRPARSARR